MTLSLIVILSINFNCVVTPFASYKQINPHLPKLANKYKGTVPRANAESQLIANNFYRRNCIDLKPVPIIRFIFQSGFRKVWDSDPSGFGILKCPSLRTRLKNFVGIRCHYLIYWLSPNIFNSTSMYSIFALLIRLQ